MGAREGEELEVVMFSVGVAVVVGVGMDVGNAKDLRGFDVSV